MNVIFRIIRQQSCYYQFVNLSFVCFLENGQISDHKEIKIKGRVRAKAKFVSVYASVPHMRL